MAYSKNVKRLIISLCKKGDSAELIVGSLSKQTNHDLAESAKSFNLSLNRADIMDIRKEKLSPKTVRAWLSEEKRKKESLPSKPLHDQNVSQVKNDTVGPSEKLSQEIYESSADKGKVEQSKKPRRSPRLARHYEDLRQLARRIIDEIRLPQLENLYVENINKPGTFEQIAGDPEMTVFAWSVDVDKRIRLLIPAENDTEDEDLLRHFEAHISESAISDLMGKRRLKGGEVLGKWHDLVNLVAKTLRATGEEELEDDQLGDEKLDSDEWDEYLGDAMVISENAIRMVRGPRSTLDSADGQLRSSLEELPFTLASPMKRERLENLKKQFKEMREYYSKDPFTEEVAGLMNDLETLDNSLVKELEKFIRTVWIPGICDDC